MSKREIQPEFLSRPTSPRHRFSRTLIQLTCLLSSRVLNLNKNERKMKIFHRPKTFLAQHKQTTEDLGVTNEEDTYEAHQWYLDLTSKLDGDKVSYFSDQNDLELGIWNADFRRNYAACCPVRPD